MPTFNVLGVRIASTQIDAVIRQMREWIERRSLGNILVFANVHVVMEAQRDDEFRMILNESLNLPDGKPLSWVARTRGHVIQRRVYGPDLLMDFCSASVHERYRHFFYGGAPGVAERLGTELQLRFGVNVVGSYSPPFRKLTREEDARVVQMINAAKPDVVWIGLGCPKQEKWAYEHRDLLNVPILAAVGQAFDIHSGLAPQAPRWMRESGLEWLFRFSREPRRLWRRYLIYNSHFLYLVFLEFLGLKKFA